MPTRRLWSLIPAVLITAVFALGVIFSGTDKGRGAADQINYHQRVIRQFAEQLPTPDFRNYVSATTPLYHVAQAVLYRHITSDLRVLRMVGLAITLGLVVIVWRFVSAQASPRITMALLLPMACSIYVLDAGAWLLPDNAAWCLVAVILGMGLGERVRLGEILMLGVGLAVLVLTRQSHLWIAGVIWAMAFLSASWGRPLTPQTQESDALLANLDRRIPRALIALVVTIPSFLIVAWFWRLWGGRLVPPIFVEWYARGSNPSAPVFLLALGAVYSAFFAGYLLPAFSMLLRRRVWVLALGAGIGLLAWLAAPSNYDLDNGRYGGLWSIARKLPMLGERSLFMLGGAVAGGILLACWAAALDFRRRWIFLTAIAAFFTAQCANAWLYQRYCEPFFLILFALAAASIAGQGLHVEPTGEDEPGSLRPTTADALAVIASARSKVIRTLRFFGPLALAGLLMLVTLNELRTAQPVVLLPEGQVERTPKNVP